MPAINVSEGISFSAVQPENGSIPVSDVFIEEYLKSLVQKDRRKGTIDGYRRNLYKLYNDLPENKKLITHDTLARWRDHLLKSGYTPNAINFFLAAANGYLEFAGARDYQLREKVIVPESLTPELTRSEYLRLLSAAKALGKRRIYLAIKVFGNSDLPVQELENLTVEAAKAGRLNVCYKLTQEVVKFPQVLCRELLDYAAEEGITTGPILRTRNGTPMLRNNISNEIRALCKTAHVSEEKGNPRCLRRLYLSTREEIERHIELLIEQTQNQLLEEEQLTVGWE